MPKISTDLCIIGAGSGGLSIAAGAAQLGKKVILIEQGKMGGDCLNYGCVPSKALLAAAKHAEMIRTASKFGINTSKPDIDFGVVMKHVSNTIESIEPHDSQERFEGLGVNVIREHGVFTSRTTVHAGNIKVSAKFFIIATGSTPFIPPLEGLADVPYFTNETLFENTTRPDHLLIIGGGPIGIEMAQAHRRLGSTVTLIEAGQILGNDDPESIDIVRQALTNEGVTILEQSHAEKVSGQICDIKISLNDGSTISGSHLLVAVGRIPSITNIGLEKAGIEFDRRGIKTTKRLQTTNKRVFAVGDVASGPQFTHMAGDHAGTIITSLLFKIPAARKDAIVPKVTYCDPEVAQVGLTEREATEKFGTIKTARFNYADNDRARAELKTDGFIKIVTNAKGRILGASIVGSSAGELLHPWGVAIANKRTVRDFTNYIAPYPTLGELSKRVASAWYTPSLFSNRTKTLVRFLSIFD